MVGDSAEKWLARSVGAHRKWSAKGYVFAMTGGGEGRCLHVMTNPGGDKRRVAMLGCGKLKREGGRENSEGRESGLEKRISGRNGTHTHARAHTRPHPHRKSERERREEREKQRKKEGGRERKREEERKGQVKKGVFVILKIAGKSRRVTIDREKEAKS